MKDGALFGADEKGGGFGDRMGDGDEFEVEGAEGELRALGKRVDFHVLIEPGSFSLSLRICAAKGVQ